MIVRRRNPRTGEWNELDLPITNEQINKYHAGAYIQDAFPNLTPSQREFILTGYTEEDWNALFKEDEE